MITPGVVFSPGQLVTADMLNNLVTDARLNEDTIEHTHLKNTIINDFAVVQDFVQTDKILIYSGSNSATRAITIQDLFDGSARDVNANNVNTTNNLLVGGELSVTGTSSFTGDSTFTGSIRSGRELYLTNDNVTGISLTSAGNPSTDSAVSGVTIGSDLYTDVNQRYASHSFTGARNLTSYTELGSNPDAVIHQDHRINWIDGRGDYTMERLDGQPYLSNSIYRRETTGARQSLGINIGVHPATNYPGTDTIEYVHSATGHLAVIPSQSINEPVGLFSLSSRESDFSGDLQTIYFYTSIGNLSSNLVVVGGSDNGRPTGIIFGTEDSPMRIFGVETDFRVMSTQNSSAFDEHMLKINGDEIGLGNYYSINSTESNKWYYPLTSNSAVTKHNYFIGINRDNDRVRLRLSERLNIWSQNQTEIDALQNRAEGDVVFNTTTKKLMVYANSVWVPIH